MKAIYLALAIAGAVVPYIFFIPFFRTEGLALGPFIGALFANGPAAGFTADVLISSAVFWIAMANARSRGTGPHPLPFVLLNLAIGLSCALPLYLFFRHEASTAGSA